MTTPPLIAREDACDWEAWPAHERAVRGEVKWKTLISAGLTTSQALTAGVARLPPGGALRPHHHLQAEIYFIQAGTGVVTIDGEATPVEPGMAVFIPGTSPHSIVAAGESELRFAWVLAADAFGDVEYVFEPTDGESSRARAHRR